MTPAARIEWLSGPADLDGVQEVDRASFSSPWTRDMYEQELQTSGVAFIAVVRAGATPVAGYCSYRLVAGELQINNVAVRPEFRRQGFGRALVAFVLGHGPGRARHGDSGGQAVERGRPPALRRDGVRPGRGAAALLHGTRGRRPRAGRDSPES